MVFIVGIHDEVTWSYIKYLLTIPKVQGLSELYWMVYKYLMFILVKVYISETMWETITNKLFGNEKLIWNF